MFRAESRSDAEIEAALWQEVEEPVTDVELTAEAPAQESIVEPTKPEAAEVVEIKLTTYNLKKSAQASVSITPESKYSKLEFDDQLICIYKDARFICFAASLISSRRSCICVTK